MKRLLLLAVALLAACSSSTHAAAPTTTPTTAPTTAPTTTTTAVTGTPIATIATSDGNVGYRSFGSGRPLIMIMGYGGTIDQWPPSWIAALASHFRVITPDNAGMGRTSPLPTPLTVAAMANQESAFIDALHLSRADVLGWSMGGFIAQALAVEHPQQVAALVLCATLPGNGQAVAPTAAVVNELQNPSSPAAVLSLLFPASPAGQAATSQYVSQITSWPGYYGGSPGTIKDQQYSLAEWVGGSDPGGHGIGGIAVPTLVADGGSDPLVPVQNDQRLAAAIHGASLAIYPGASHAFMFQDQPQFVDRILGFL